MRACKRQTDDSTTSSAVESLGWSLLSGLSLGHVSQVSVISLPVVPRELWNGHRYQMTPNSCIKEGPSFRGKPLATIPNYTRSKPLGSEAISPRLVDFLSRNQSMSSTKITALLEHQSFFFTPRRSFNFERTKNGSLDGIWRRKVVFLGKADAPASPFWGLKITSNGSRHTSIRQEHYSQTPRNLRRCGLW